MTIYYHLCPTRLASGSIIEPGNFGQIVALWGYKHNQYGREAVLERMRQAIAESAPSRLNCVFAFLSQQDATAFRWREHENGFRTSYLYEIEAVDPEASVAIVPMNVLEGWNFNEGDERASLYWTRRHLSADAPIAIGPGMGIGADFYEVLLASAIRVMRRID